jgi:hypothetical protein
MHEEFKELMIKEYNTIEPNGLNPSWTHTKDKRKQISHTNKKKAQEKRKGHDGRKLPLYMKFTDRKDRKGYEIVSHPLLNGRFFGDSKNTIEQTYELCLAELNKLNAQLDEKDKITKGDKKDKEIAKEVKEITKEIKELIKEVKVVKVVKADKADKVDKAIKMVKEDKADKVVKENKEVKVDKADKAIKEVKVVKEDKAIKVVNEVKVVKENKADKVDKAINVVKEDNAIKVDTAIKEAKVRKLPKGVFYSDKDKKRIKAQIQYDKKIYVLGRFDLNQLDKAHALYMKYKNATEIENSGGANVDFGDIHFIECKN